MSKIVCNGTTLKCSCSAAPTMMPIIVLPKNKALTMGQPAANIKDHIPLLNIPSFVMCKSMQNPMVQAATAAALGVLTPAPCMPATSEDWKDGSPTVKLAGQPILTTKSKLKCQYGGMIEIVQPAQTIVNTK